MSVEKEGSEACERFGQCLSLDPPSTLVRLAARLNLAFAEIHQEIPRSAVLTDGEYFHGRFGKTLGADENHMVATPAWYGEWGLLVEAFRPTHDRPEHISGEAFKPSPAVGAVLEAVAAELAVSAREGLPAFVRRDRCAVILTCTAAVSADTVALDGTPHLVIGVAPGFGRREKRILCSWRPSSTASPPLPALSFSR